MQQHSIRNVSETIGAARWRYVLAVLLLAAGAGSARAATCPAFPAPVIKFTAMPAELERDTSLSAKDLGKTISIDKAMPSGYGRAVSGAAAQSMSVAKLSDGTVCAAVREVEFKLGIKRKIYVAQELATDSCVADTVADIEMPLARSDDETLARFGSTLSAAYAGDLAGIGTSVGANPEDARKPLIDKVSVIWRDKIFPAFEHEMSAAAAKVDLGKWKKAPCDGATDKAFSVLAAHGGAFDNANWQAMLQQFQQQQQSRSATMTGGMMGSGMMGGMGH
jgi:hypothetical protein